MAQDNRQTADKIIEQERRDAGGTVSDAELARRIAAKYPQVFGTERNDVKALERRLQRETKAGRVKDSRPRPGLWLMAVLGSTGGIAAVAIIFLVVFVGISTLGGMLGAKLAKRPRSDNRG